MPMKSEKEDKVWNTAAGEMKSKAKTKSLEFCLPELQSTRKIRKSFHVVNMDIANYDMIIGRDLMTSIGLDVRGSDQSIQWDDAILPWRDIDVNHNEVYLATPQDSEIKRLTEILDAKYEKADLRKVVANATHLSKAEQQELYTLLASYKDLFDGTLGKFTGKPYDIKLKPNVTPQHVRSFPVPKLHELTLKTELDRLVKLGVLKKVNRSEWGAPTFVIPKKDGSVRFISDFRLLNKCIQRQPYPIPKIQHLLQNLEGFKYGTALDLNMGYYHLELSAKSKELCTITTQWGKYEYQRLPMGLCNSPDIFQERMNEVLDGLESVRVYIDDVLHVTKGSFTEHLDGLREILDRLRQAGLKVNANKSSFAAPEMEYLGYMISREGIRPLPKKIQGIRAIKTPKTRKELKRFIGMINFYRDMWKGRAKLLDPLSSLTSKAVPFKWESHHQEAFEAIKRVLSREVLLAYPDFNAPFEIHTDASKHQIGAVISQRGKPIAFYSKKMNSAQKNYTVTEKELLSIVETLKEFRNILLGMKITVYTDHKNLTYKNFNTERVMRWRLVLEEFGPELVYLKGETNVVADALSRLDMKSPEELFNINDDIGYDDEDLPEDSFPLRYEDIRKAQRTDKQLLKHLKDSPSEYQEVAYPAGEGQDISLICRGRKICVPPKLQQRIVNWYHERLCHPGHTRTEETIRQHFEWKGLRTMVRDTCRKCATCQKAKKSNVKYGKLPAKEADYDPWEVLQVDLIGPYEIKKGRKKLKLWCVTMIDPATGWFEMEQIENKTAAEVADIVELTWLTRYPYPRKIILDRGTEFMAEFARMVKTDYGLKIRAISTRNPQANAILERIHQTIGNIIKTYDVKNIASTQDPWTGILAATMFAVRATYHTTLQASPMQLVFGRDAILNVKHTADWEHIKSRRQRIINANNERENKSRRHHEYQVDDKILIKARKDFKHAMEWEGPYRITKVNNDNGTVRYQKGIVNDVVNIRRIKPFHE